MQHRGITIPDGLARFAERMPGEVVKVLGAVDLMSRCLAAQHYEGQACAADGRRDRRLASGFRAMADEVLAAPVDSGDTGAQVAELLEKAASCSGDLRLGYQQRAAELARTRPDPRFTLEAERIVKSATPKRAAGLILKGRR